MVARIRRVADTLNRYEIAARLADAITDAADAVHTRAFEEAQFGEASADAIVDCEYYDDLAAAWSLVASEHQLRMEEHTSELQSLMRISYAVFCLNKKKPQSR